jgi:hypothetical protein
MDAAYFARVEAIQFTIAHDDGIGAKLGRGGIVLAGVSRTSKTPTSIYPRQPADKIPYSRSPATADSFSVKRDGHWACHERGTADSGAAQPRCR